MSMSNRTGRNGRTPVEEPAEYPDDARAWRELALDSLISGEPASGLWFLRNAIEVDADDPETWQLMGRCFEEMGEAARARNCFLLALRQHSQAGAFAHPRRATQLSASWRRGPSRDV